MRFSQTRIEDPTTMMLAIVTTQMMMPTKLLKDFLKNTECKMRTKKNSLSSITLTEGETIMKSLEFPKTLL